MIFAIFAQEITIKMKKYILIALALIAACVTMNAQDKKSESKVKHLTYNEFLHKVWDFESSPDVFRYRGKLPAIVDFYADWCGPCRRVAPIMEKLAEEYDGQLLVYKVNVDQERDLANAFQVKSIPMVLFIPVGETSQARGAKKETPQPMMQVGAMTEEAYRQVVEEQLLKK